MFTDFEFTPRISVKSSPWNQSIVKSDHKRHGLLLLPLDLSLLASKRIWWPGFLPRNAYRQCVSTATPMITLTLRLGLWTNESELDFSPLVWSMNVCILTWVEDVVTQHLGNWFEHPWLALMACLKYKTFESFLEKSWESHTVGRELTLGGIIGRALGEKPVLH